MIPYRDINVALGLNHTYAKITDSASQARREVDGGLEGKFSGPCSCFDYLPPSIESDKIGSLKPKLEFYLNVRCLPGLRVIHFAI